MLLIHFVSLADRPVLKRAHAPRSDLQFTQIDLFIISIPLCLGQPFRLRWRGDSGQKKHAKSQTDPPPRAEKQGPAGGASRGCNRPFRSLWVRAGLDGPDRRCSGSDAIDGSLPFRKEIETLEGGDRTLDVPARARLSDRTARPPGLGSIGETESHNNE